MRFPTRNDARVYPLDAASSKELNDPFEGRYHRGLSWRSLNNDVIQSLYHPSTESLVLDTRRLSSLLEFRDILQCLVELRAKIAYGTGAERFVGRTQVERLWAGTPIRAKTVTGAEQPDARFTVHR